MKALTLELDRQASTLAGEITGPRKWIQDQLGLMYEAGFEGSIPEIVNGKEECRAALIDVPLAVIKEVYGAYARVLEIQDDLLLSWM